MIQEIGWYIMLEIGWYMMVEIRQTRVWRGDPFSVKLSEMLDALFGDASSNIFAINLYIDAKFGS